MNGIHLLIRLPFVDTAPQEGTSLRIGIMTSLGLKEAVLFDLGNTLVRYWDRAGFPAVLAEALAGVQERLRAEGLLRVPADSLLERAMRENQEAGDHRVRPLEDRLRRVFDLDQWTPPELMDELCRLFVRPLIVQGRIYDDTLPALDRLRGQGRRLAVVSNLPWGSPPEMWREEVFRLGIGERVEAVVFCRDVGWRKPARQIFEHALQKLDLPAARCLFVGDDPRWDLNGPRAIGMEALLIDRAGAAGPPAIRDLRQLLELLGLRT